MYRIEWIWPLAPLGALILLTLPLAGVVFAGLLVLLSAAAIFVALVAAIIAPPVLVARAVHRHWRSGGTQPADTSQARVSRAAVLIGRGPQTAAPQARAPLAAPLSGLR